jgi:hypothetical protein
MKPRINKLAAALATTLGLGFAGHASADVYGLGFLEIDNLSIEETAPGFGVPGGYTFNTNADAILNGNPDLSSGAANCGGVFGGGTSCVAGDPVLSGTVQNAPGSTVARGENDYTIFGLGSQYSNSEAAIEDAVLLGDASTATKQIAESNLIGGESAQANTNVGSNTFIEFFFELTNDVGELTVSFDAIIDVLAQVTAPSEGLARASSSLSVNLTNAAGQTVLSWSPDGNGTVATCATGACVATETGPSLNNSVSSFGAPNQVAGTGNYELVISDLAAGEYTIALAATTSTDLIRFPVPVPGTLLLLGTGLMLGSRTLRRKA